ncbi:hypothetical protein [Sinimarinibacterium thermocellulolyticum]|uniref:HTH araC/xylS-type domain-containing protein n=1 Tax=Sinimarinibacterium thermocellulolyticum TaxID=3170016 RepID=A0ABV2A7J9_9GAMM
MLQVPDVQLCQIAFMLGCAEQSAFHSAFRHRTGQSSGDRRRAAEAKAVQRCLPTLAWAG